MSNRETSYDGALISELGVKRYLKGIDTKKFSNIIFLFVALLLEEPGKNVTLAVMGRAIGVSKNHLQKANSCRLSKIFCPHYLAWLTAYTTKHFGLVDRLAGGINRTAEGLHITGQQKF